jgi:ketosteroid isomerase-like protein
MNFVNGLRMRTRAIVILLLTVCCGRALLFAQEAYSSSEAELRAVMAERRKAGLEGDTEKIASSMADEYRQTDISGYVQDKTTWLNEYFKPLAELIKAGKFRPEVYEQKDVQLRIFGDCAVVIGKLEVKVRGARPGLRTWVADPNASFSGTLRFTHVYVKRNGKWLLAALHNAVPLPPPPPAK